MESILERSVRAPRAGTRKARHQSGRVALIAGSDGRPRSPRAPRPKTREPRPLSRPGLIYVHPLTWGDGSSPGDLRHELGSISYLVEPSMNAPAHVQQ